MQQQPSFLTSIAVVLLAGASAAAAGLSDLTEIRDWRQVAHGVWTAQLGDMKAERRYTDWAIAPPRVEALEELSVEPFPFSDDAIKFRLDGDRMMAVRIPTLPDERLFGFGLQFDGSQKNGRILELKVDHFNTGGGATHAPVPFYISSRGYGVFFNTARYLKVYCDIGNRKESSHNPLPVDRNPPPDEPQPGPWLAQPPGDAVEAYLRGAGLELVIFRGQTLLDVVARYNLYCGGGAMPPLWGLGFWHRVPSDFSADQTEHEIAEFDSHRIPLDVIGLEPGWQTKSYPCTYEWQKKRFPDPAGFTKRLLSRGVRLNLWMNPYVSPEARIYDALYPLSGSHLVWLGIVPDYTLSAARKVLTDQHRTDHLQIGISGYKVDEVDGYDFWLWPDHATFPSTTPAEVMRQTYGLQMQKMMHDELFQPANQRTYGLVRASNGAASGYPFAIYSDSYGHGEYLRGISAASLCGILWCPEIRSANNSREWLNRMQLVSFSPMAMLNAWASGQKPWSFADVTDEVRDTIELRMRLLPYLYTAFAEYHRHGIPPVRSLLLETRAGEPPLNDDSIYLFGPDILVAPFYEKRSNSRTIQLPPGDWYDFYSGEYAGSNKLIERNAADTGNRLPLLVKDGAVIPLLNASVQNTEAAYGHDLEIRHYGRRAGQCLLYEDDGKTYGFGRGEFRVRRFTVNEQGDFKEEILSDKGPKMFGAVQSVRRMSSGGIFPKPPSF